MVHTGYLSGSDNPYRYNPTGATFGIGGVAKVHLTDHFRAGFEGYFSSVPKPSVDSTWVEETQMPLKDWGKNAYTLYKYFKNSNSSKISKEFSEYKNELISKGFKFYEESFDHYTYVKDDISVTIFEGVEHMSVELKSGFQAVHN